MCSVVCLSQRSFEKVYFFFAYKKCFGGIKFNIFAHAIVKKHMDGMGTKWGQHSNLHNWQPQINYSLVGWLITQHERAYPRKTLGAWLTSMKSIFFGWSDRHMKLMKDLRCTYLRHEFAVAYDTKQMIRNPIQGSKKPTYWLNRITQHMLGIIYFTWPYINWTIEHLNPLTWVYLNMVVLC